MYESFINYVNGLLSNPLTDEEIDIIKSSFLLKKLRKHQFFLEEGEICKSAGFIVKGALKQYTVDSNGKENILGLFVDHWWAGDRESFMKEIPSPYYIEAFEPTEILIITKANYVEKVQNQRFMNDLMRILIERQSLQLLKRVHAAQTLNAEQRLYEFENNYPEFMQRFPQHIIASYLGMTKETLSRIRANALKK